MSINALTTTNYNIGQDNDWSITSLSTTISWSFICCSSNGKYVATCGTNSKIWISSDYGVTWTEKNTAYPTKNWNCICMSSTGKYIYACETTTNNIWKSSDYGNTFQTLSQGGAFSFITCSYDGKYIITFFNGSKIYVSTNFGLTFSQNSGTANWISASISETGQYMIALINGGNIYYCFDYGITWYSTFNLIKNFICSTISNNGSIVYICVNGEYIYKSTDNGITWTAVKNDATYYWYYISCSSSGKYVMACTYGDSIVNLNYTGGNIWISSDYGVTWINSTSALSNKNWVSSIMSSSGQYLYSFTGNVATTNGSIGVYKNTQSVELGDFYYSPPDIYSTNYLIPDTDSITTTTAPSGIWNKIAMSNDAKYLIACRYDGDKMYYSNDSGNTWSASNSTNGYWYDCAISYNGQYAIACQLTTTNGLNDGNVFFSSDFGVTWTNQNAYLGTRQWNAVTISSDGKILLAGANTSNLWISKDYAYTWNSYLPNIFWNGFAISYNNKFFYGCNGTNGSVYSSTDGITWTAFSGILNRNYHAITCSFNGQYIATTALSGYIYVSSDYGSSWTAKLSDTNRNWYDIAYSYSGKYGVACVNNGNIYLSTDYGETWIDQSGTFGGIKAWGRVGISSTAKYIFATERGTGKIYKYSRSQDVGEYIGCPPGNYDLGYNTIQKKYVFKEKNVGGPFFSVACSNTGQYIICGGKNFYIYTSSDYGQTWTKQTNSGVKDWVGVACSSTGLYMVAADRTSGAGYIYTSYDYGVTWIAKTNSGQRNWVSLCCSSDATKIFAAVYAGYLYYSNDAGETWTQKSSALNWYGISCSTDGSKRIACTSGGQLYISSDSSANIWTGTESGRYWKSVACSGNGTYMIAIVEVTSNTTSPNNYDNYIYVSSNSGSTWSKKGIIGKWYGVGCSNDGSVMVATNNGGKIYISTDYGSTWVETGPTRNWFYCSVSNNANYIFCIDNTLGSIFIANSNSTNTNKMLEIISSRQ